MTDLSKKAALILDHGVFVELAFRLAREDGFGTVYYCDPTWQAAFATIDHAIIGDGFAEIRRVREPWKLIDSGAVDCVIYPDVHHAEEQEHVESLGMPVWGGRSADLLELNKWRFKKIQDELGMPHAKYDLLEGMDELREYCQDPANNDRFIKMTPQFRGNRETFHHENYERSRQTLAEMDKQFGVVGNVLRFLAEHKLKGKLEGGIDTYSIDGAHPGSVVSGWEIKDKCYFAEVLAWDKVNPVLREAIEPIFPILKSRRCRQMLSTEVMIEDKALLEPTVRFPSPAGEEQMELYANFPQIIWEGAHGRCIEPEIAKHFACEAMIEHTDDDDSWRSLKVPPSIRKWTKLYNVCQVGDLLATAPGCNIIGAVVGLGDSPQECLEHLKANAEGLKDQPVIVHVEALAKALQEIETAQEKGVGFESETIPEPAEALTET